MHCKKCGAKIEETYTDFVASYIGYVERYVDCWECRTVTIFKYNLTEVVGSYPMSRYEDEFRKGEISS